MYGDTAAARKRVGQLREQAGDIRATADRLVARAESVPWHGRAAESMRARIKERAAHLRTAAAAHDTAADSLARHLGEVDRLKDAIEVREHKARSLVDDARTRAAQDGRAPTPDATDDDAERALLAFTPPPAGHLDWLTAELPGL
jgi:hypothetical protein